MEDEEKQKEVSFVWSDVIITRNHDGKEPLTLHSLKLVVSFNILTGYFQDCMSKELFECNLFIILFIILI
jgi:hypothetical protein